MQEQQYFVLVPMKSEQVNQFDIDKHLFHYHFVAQYEHVHAVQKQNFFLYKKNSIFCYYERKKLCETPCGC